jgi:hypothetical protein
MSIVALISLLVIGLGIPVPLPAKEESQYDLYISSPVSDAILQGVIPIVVALGSNFGPGKFARVSVEIDGGNPICSVKRLAALPIGFIKFPTQRLESISTLARMLLNGQKNRCANCDTLPPEC